MLKGSASPLFYWFKVFDEQEMILNNACEGVIVISYISSEGESLVLGFMQNLTITCQKVYAKKTFCIKTKKKRQFGEDLKDLCCVFFSNYCHVY